MLSTHKLVNEREKFVEIFTNAINEIPKIDFCHFIQISYLFIYCPSYTTLWCKVKLYNNMQSYMFRPHGVIFSLIKYGIMQGTSIVITYGIPWFTIR